MPKSPPLNLSRRERQIMDVLYRLGRATVAEVTGQLADPPTSTTVRGLLRILEEKGHARHDQDGQRYVYVPSVARDTAGASVITHVVRTFFDGSAAEAMAALLGSSRSKLSDAELERLSDLIERVRARRAE